MRPFRRDCDAMSAANSHGQQGIGPADAFQVVRHSDDRDGFCRAEWIVLCNRAVDWLYLFPVKAKILLTASAFGAKASSVSGMSNSSAENRGPRLGLQPSVRSPGV